MSNLQFEQADKEKTALIYLRNTNYKVKLSFIKCSLQQKFKYLTAYIKNDFRILDTQLSNTWMKILNLAIGQQTNIEGIISEQECHTYIQQNLELVKDVLTFCYSLPLYLIYRYKIEDCSINMNISKNENYIPKSWYDLAKAEGYTLLFGNMCLDPVFYTNCFTDDNNDLFDSLKDSIFLKLLVTIGNNDKVDLEKVLNSIKENKNINIELEEKPETIYNKLQDIESIIELRQE